MGGGRRVAALAAALSLAVACGRAPRQAVTSTGDVAVVTTPAGAVVEVEHPTSEALVVVAWAVSRFEVAGLPEPTVDRVEFDAGEVGCGDVGGWASTSSDAATVVFCLDLEQIHRHESGEVVVSVAGRMCLLHELAHLWLVEHTTDGQRRAFVELTGARAWRDPTQPWADRGVEMAADTIAWGLLGESIELLGRPLPRCELLLDAFRALTGVAPTSSCGASGSR